MRQAACLTLERGNGLSGPMTHAPTTHAPRELLPGWRAGLLVLGLYAMLMQAFLGALAGPSHAFSGTGDAVLCVAGQTSSSEASSSEASSNEAPAAPMRHGATDCVCAALCHAAGALPAAAAASLPVAPFAIVLSSRLVDDLASAKHARALPPARAPPRAGFVLIV